MSSALMKIDQAGLAAGSNGKARLDGLNTGAVVTLTSADPGTTNEFRLLDVPANDTTAVSSLAPSGGGSTPIWTFSPTAGAWGAYRIELVVDEGLDTEDRQILIFGIAAPSTGLIPPALGERGDPNATLLNDGADVLANTERNVDSGGADSVRGYEPFFRDVAEAVESGVGGYPPKELTGKAITIPTESRLGYVEDMQIEDDGDVIIDGDLQSSFSLDNHLIHKVPTRQKRRVPLHETMLSLPELVVDGELEVDGQLRDFPVSPPNSTEMLTALGAYLGENEVLGKTTALAGITPAILFKWLTAVNNANQLVSSTTGAEEGFAFGSSASWLQASVASNNGDGSNVGLVIRGLLADPTDETFNAIKILVNSGSATTIGFLDENDAQTDTTEAYRIKTPNAESFYLSPGAACLAVYDASSSRWIIAALSNNEFLYEPSIGGTYYAFPLGDASLHRWIRATIVGVGPVLNSIIHGFQYDRQYSSTSILARRFKVLVNTGSGYNLTLVNNSTSASENAQRIITTTGKDIILGPGEMIAMVRATLSAGERWICSKIGKDALPSYMEMYLDSNTTATTPAQNPTFTQIAGTYAAGYGNDFSHSAGTLTYNGDIDKTFRVTVSLSATAAGAETYEFRIAVNGTTVAKSKARCYKSGSNDLAEHSLTCLIVLSDGDEVDVHVAGDSASPPNITITDMNLNLSEIV